MAKATRTNTTNLTRRAVLRGAVAVPAAATAALIPTGPADGDISLVHAWSEACGIRARLPYATEADSERHVDRLEELHHFIAESPAASLIGVGIKLRLLSWLNDNGSFADWQGDLIRTALVTVTASAPQVWLDVGA